LIFQKKINSSLDIFNEAENFSSFSHGKESEYGEVNLKYWLRLPIIMELK
jgi:hypothetical protein